MEQDSTAAQRLGNIWREWSLGHTSELKKQQRAALEALAERLREAGSTAVLRGVQALLADPEISGVGKRDLFTMWWQCVDEAWPGAGDQEGHVPQLQAMLLAAWPRDQQDGGFGMLPMLVSPWEVMRGRDVQQAKIYEWLNDSSLPSREPRRAKAVPEATQDALWGKTLAQLKEVSASLSRLEKRLEEDGYPSRNGTEGIVDFAKFVAKSLGDDIPVLLEKVSQPIPIPLSNVEELLWWGQARYCHTLRKPFRRLGNSETCLWWAAWEAAERADGLPVEPAASYLQEVLHMLGQTIDEQQPLSQWLERLHGGLQQSEHVEPVSPELAALAETDALGLPVTWIRLRANEPFDAERAGEAVALPLDTRIDRGQWAAWVFREIMLDRFFEDA